MLYESSLTKVTDTTMSCNHKLDLARVMARISDLAKAERIRLNVITDTVRAGLVFGSTYPVLLVTHPLSLTIHYRNLVVAIDQRRGQVTVHYYLRGKDVYGKQAAKQESRLNRGARARHLGLPNGFCMPCDSGIEQLFFSC